ncbi:hypothetical protein TREPR_2170 [Treponema primitia ZAS-2]|uniref:Uncharacterized protein n=1 Tax=Treponema primitia (strain ATCC BAA-887 / DSM 12427 / ZAS-2) TaxID=545694 RepID=F5YJ32_TREPZ|nr:hypothetical protein TREPR_2170 [Treponema primitia ZAS-2]
MWGFVEAKFASHGLASQALILAGKPSYTINTLYEIFRVKIEEN